MTTFCSQQPVQRPPGATMGSLLTQRERELGAIIDAYNKVTDQLRESHDLLSQEVIRLREELEGKNRQLQRRERLAALGELAAGVAHEIRNPLGGIMLFASMLNQDLKDRPGSQEVVQKIVKGVGMLEAIVNDILEFGRPSRAVPRHIELKALVQETIELVSPQVDQADVTMTVSAELAKVSLVTDETMLRRALLNLLLNAVESAGQNAQEGRTGLVHIAMGGGDDEDIVVVIEDNGAGIPADHLDRIFNPFFTTKDHGTGLGLSIVHQIAETLGGGVSAGPRQDGGAVFSLRLPREWRED